MSQLVPPVTTPKTVRCAVYTRKSTEEGLDKAFTSLDAQREAGLAYIHSQQHAGWTALPQRYDDGGYSGGTMDRPALAQLLRDIEAGQVDCVVVHKVDRFSRSLLDFAKMMEILESHQVAFASVTQQLNTATSMGRLRRTEASALSLPPLPGSCSTQIWTRFPYFALSSCAVCFMTWSRCPDDQRPRTTCST